MSNESLDDHIDRNAEYHANEVAKSDAETAIAEAANGIRFLFTPDALGAFGRLFWKGDHSQHATDPRWIEAEKAATDLIRARYPDSSSELREAWAVLCEEAFDAEEAAGAKE